MTHAERELLLAMARAIETRILDNRVRLRLSEAIKAVEEEIKSEAHL